jgi:hypothetical protein
MESRMERAQGYRKEARKYAELASSGARDITMNFMHRKLADQYIWMAEDLERMPSDVWLEFGVARSPVT